MGRRPTQYSPKSNYITPEGFFALQQELDRLWRVERPKVAEAVAVAAAMGDRSENADYQYGKRRLREIDHRVEYLDRRLKVLHVVDLAAPRIEAEKVSFGAWVKLEDPQGEVVVYRIVGPDEFDVQAGKISMDSPMGRALLKKAEGDTVVVRRPKGDAEYAILEVSYNPLSETE